MRILLFSLLSFFCISANAGWIKLNQNQAMDTAYFIDLENIRGGTEKVRIWTLTDYTNIQVTKKINYQSIKSFVEINCQSKKMRILAYSLYEQPINFYYFCCIGKASGFLKLSNYFMLFALIEFNI